MFSILVLASLGYSLSPMVAICSSALYGLAVVWQYRRLPAVGWRTSIQGLHVDVYGEMTLTFNHGERWLVDVGGESLVHPWCMSLRLHYRQLLSAQTSAGQGAWRRPRWLLILPDHADQDSLHALRLWLRWGKR